MSETPETPKVDEPVNKPSRLKKFKSNATTAAFYGVPVLIVGGSMYYYAQITKTQLETAKLALETAKLKSQS